MKSRKRIVIKIGTAVITHSGRMRGPGSDFDIPPESALGSLVKDMAIARQTGHDVILVSSGAIGAGVKQLGLSARPQDLPNKQAAAAVGQVVLMENYKSLFQTYDTAVAQVLLSRGDFADRARYLNAKATLSALLKMDVVPIINENDTVATEEIRFGDNDRLSSLVAAKMDAAVLIILSDVEGLYRSRAAGSANRLVRWVPKITPEIEKMVWAGKTNAVGTGGMASKIAAAKVATQSGVVTVLANAFRPNVIGEILSGQPIGTRFGTEKTLSPKKRWILFSAIPEGKICLRRADFSSGKNLRADLVASVKGDFAKGAVVDLADASAQVFARGVARLSSVDLRRWMAAERRLGAKQKSPEIILRDSWVVAR